MPDPSKVTGRVSRAPQIIGVILLFYFALPSEFLFSQESFKQNELLLMDTVINHLHHKQQQKSKKFYDSVYVKFSRHKMTRMIYGLAFADIQQVGLSDSLQKIESEIPFKKFKGKVIRSVRIYSLSPFGSSVMDSITEAKTGVGKALNKMHVNTRKFVIRKNLLFKKGERLDPDNFADNERILRDLPGIDNARIVVTPSSIAGDSVDVVVITKDVWSIGANLLTVTDQRVNFSIYDANFVGLDHRISLKFSVDRFRAPFFKTDGIFYNFTNIGGSFIDGYINLNRQDNGNQSAIVALERSFLVNKFKWAGGAYASYMEDHSVFNDTVTITSIFNTERLWFGWAFPLKKEKDPTRIVVTGAVYNRNYTLRPYVSIDSNRQYYNGLQALTGLSLSSNNYYLTNYVFDYGKTENIPYGHLFQVIAGPYFDEFYTRVYCGGKMAMGNYWGRAGYFSGRFAVGGFIDEGRFEDAVLKAQFFYMTNLFLTPSKYRFRFYTSMDYRFGFNFRSNNNDYYNIDQFLTLLHVNNQEPLKGTQSVAANLYTAMFTPWYFYGFKFALLYHLQGGFAAAESTDALLIGKNFHAGFRLGLTIKNDNLVFPAYMLSLFFYTNTTADIPWFQYSFTNGPSFHVPDFNVSAPYIETLQN